MQFELKIRKFQEHLQFFKIENGYEAYVLDDFWFTLDRSYEILKLPKCETFNGDPHK